MPNLTCVGREPQWYETLLPRPELWSAFTGICKAASRKLGQPWLCSDKLSSVKHFSYRKDFTAVVAVMLSRFVVLFNFEYDLTYSIGSAQHRPSIRPTDEEKTGTELSLTAQNVHGLALPLRTVLASGEAQPLPDGHRHAGYWAFLSNASSCLALHAQSYVFAGQLR